MTKLRNIQTTCDNCGHTPALTDECIERIKELMLEVIETAADGGIRHSTPLGSSEQWDETRLVSSLRKKVEEL